MVETLSTYLNQTLSHNHVLVLSNLAIYIHTTTSITIVFKVKFAKICTLLKTTNRLPESD